MRVGSFTAPFAILYFTPPPWLFCNYLFVLLNLRTSSPISPQSPPIWQPSKCSPYPWFCLCSSCWLLNTLIRYWDTLIAKTATLLHPPSMLTLCNVTLWLLPWRDIIHFPTLWICAAQEICSKHYLVEVIVCHFQTWVLRSLCLLLCLLNPCYCHENSLGQPAGNKKSHRETWVVPAEATPDQPDPSQPANWLKTHEQLDSREIIYGGCLWHLFWSSVSLFQLPIAE